MTKRKRKKTSPASRPVPSLSSAKQRLFRLLLFLIPIVLLCTLELLLHLLKVGGDRRLFVPTPDKNSKYFGINRAVCKRYFQGDNFVPSPRKDLFLQQKPENGFRIFVLGGSTTAGFPYGNNLTFPRILHRRLVNTFPEKRIEVVNMAMTAINTYTLLDFMDEILHQEPDMILIYAGHNEYYGALGISSMESLGRTQGLARLSLRLQRFRTFILLRQIIGRVKSFLGKSSQESVERDPMKTIMSRIVRDQSIVYGSSLYERGKNQFKSNMETILQKASDADVPVVLSELVSNVQDQAPFVSESSTEYPSADAVFERALDFERADRLEEAKHAYYLAKDLDVIRFRAAEDLNVLIHEFGQDYQIPVVPMKTVFESASPDGLIGSELMHEHLHPNKHGYFLMAEAFYQTLRENRMIRSNWPEAKSGGGDRLKNIWGFSRLDSTFAALTIRHLKGGWPFKEKSVPNTALLSYRPKTVEDSIALEILIGGELTLEKGHIRLAKLFEERGRYGDAFEEYMALIYTVPSLDIFYEMTIAYLLRHKQYGRLLGLLKEGVAYNPSPLLFKWIGQLYLTQGQTSEGIQVLERVRKESPDDAQILMNLARAYYKLRRFKDGDARYQRLRFLYPGSPDLKQLEVLRRAMGQNP